MTTVEVKLTLSDEVLGSLQDMAARRHVPLDVVVSEAVAAYFEEPDAESILATIRHSLLDGLAGRTRPVDEVLAELKAEFDADADER